MLKLKKWNLGISLLSDKDPEAFIYFRFYEWTLFDAVNAGDHERGKDDWKWTILSDETKAQVRGDWLNLNMHTVEDGADMVLSITNTTDHDWPEIAAIIPCLGAEYLECNVPANPGFFDENRENTYFLSSSGLELLKAREIHYDERFYDFVLRRSPFADGVFDKMSFKWPHSDTTAKGGFMVRESSNKHWVTGIAWEDSLSSQGHNPRRCMHLSVRVGPLDRGETKSIKGRIYLFRGNKEDCLHHYLKDFRINSL